MSVGRVCNVSLLCERFIEKKMLKFDKFKIIILQTLLVQCYCGSVDKEPLFLTPLIKAGKIEEAQDAARVKNLVVSEHNHEIISYSGFLTVQPEYNSNLFFWFVPCQVNQINFHTSSFA